MAQNNCRIWIILICLLSLADNKTSSTEDPSCEILEKDPMNCTNHNFAYLVKVNDSSLFIADNVTFCWGLEKTILVQNTTFPTVEEEIKKMPKVDKSGFLLLTNWHIKKDLTIHILKGSDCIILVNETYGKCDSGTNIKKNPTATCTLKCVETNTVCKKSYDENDCKEKELWSKDLLFLNVTDMQCVNCNDPVKQPNKTVDLKDEMHNLTAELPTGTDKPLAPEIAAKVMESFTKDFVRKFNESTVALSMGESITGVLMKQKDPRDMEEVSFAYTRVNESFNILGDRNVLTRFPRSVTVSKEAFDKALSMNVTEPFAAVFRFLNMSKDEYNNSVLGDEVIAIEMGTVIKNLTDTINVNFWNMSYRGIPTCYSWNGSGSRPKWNNDGCETVIRGINVTCRCTHMTFFAVLLTPLNETISTSDLNILTTITRIGCGISMFFLGIVLFMHFVMRRGSSSISTKLLIHLVLAMFLLVFSFLVNDLVAKAKNVVGCKIMAASMHYFMLSTFTWFAVHAFHLCMQLYSGGQIQIQRYLLKVSIISWVMPSIITIVLLSVGKYGEVTINTESTSASMCWILDNDVHYIVNIGFYAFVFLFTFSTFVLMLTWLYCVRRNQKAAAQGKNASSCQNIVTIMGLCCILGVTWSCAFFAYGVFRVPAYYLFTVLNSFQGFCLFIFYHKTSRIVESKDSHSSSSSSTIKTNLDEIFNPYDNYGLKPKPE